MRTQRLRHLLYSGLLLSGTACVTLAYQQQQYTRFLAVGNQAVAEKRFDSQEYTQASRLWFADQNRLLFNQGVLAYTAGNAPQAADFFRRVSQHTANLDLQTHALYNLGVVLLNLQDIQGAMEFLKTALRLNPHDTDAKFTLEQLYSAVQSLPGDSPQQASNPQGAAPSQEGSGPLQQAPGVSEDQGENGTSASGQGRSKPRSGI